MAIATGNNVKFVYVTGNSLPASPDQDTIYFVAGAQELYVGSALIANYDEGTMHLADLSVVDEGTGTFVTDVTYNTSNGEFTLTRADATEYNFTVTTTSGGNYITAASYDSGSHTLTLTEGKLPEYSIGTVATSSGYAKTYSLMKDGVAVSGSTIDIPKDLVVSAGEVKTVTTADQPYSGAQVGDKYIDLTLNDSSASHIYIPVKDLVDVYTGGTHITVSSANVISHDAQGSDASTALGTDNTGSGTKALHVSGQVQYDALGHVISVADKDIASAVDALAKAAFSAGTGITISTTGEISNSNPLTWTVVS